jgi:hypothetical protein
MGQGRGPGAPRLCRNWRSEAAASAALRREICQLGEDLRERKGKEKKEGVSRIL